MPKHLKSSQLAPAVGYLRLADDTDVDVFAALLKEIAACCQREDLFLKHTFVDRGYDGTQLARPGIVELQQALKDTQGLAVVLPTLEHLSPADSIRRALVLMVRRLDGHLVVIHKDDHSDTDLPNDEAAQQSEPCGQDGGAS
jgi:hypothetical protein